MRLKTSSTFPCGISESRVFVAPLPPPSLSARLPLMDREPRDSPSLPAPEWPSVVMAEPANRFDQASRWRGLLRRYGLALRQRWWLPVLSLAVIGGSAGLYGGLRKPTYRAEASMWMASKLSQVALPDISPYSEELSRILGTEADLVLSEAVQWRAYQQVLRQYPEVRREESENAPPRLPFKLKVHSNAAKSTVLELKAVGEHRAATQAFLNAVMEAYLDFKRQARAKTSGNSLVSITEQIRELEQHLREQQVKIDAFQRSNNVAYLTEQETDAGSQLAKLEAQISDLRTEFQVLNLLSPQEVMDMRKGQGLGLSTLALPGQKTTRELTPQLNPSAQAYYETVQRLQLLKAERDHFAQSLRPGHSKMIRFDQEIAGLEKLLKALEEEDQQQTLEQVASLKRSLDLQIQNFEQQHQEWERAAVSASAKLAEFEPLKQERQRSQALYERLLNLVQTVDLNQNLEQDSLSIVEPASRAYPTYTGLLITIAGVLFSLLVGVGLVFVAESLDDRFICAQELNLQLPEEIVGQIPEISSPGTGESRRLRRKAIANGLEEREAFAESFRSLRSSLLFRFEPAHPPKVILLTSALPEEGKTTVAVNLAASLAAAGFRVLLVDADLHRNSLHRVFHVPQSPGLREVLRQEVSLTQTIVPIHGAAPTASAASPDHQTLFLLPAGEASAGSSEIFLGGQMERLRQEAASHYDYVVMDTAPILATDEATTLGPQADGVLMVVRALSTSASTARDALERLTKRRVKVLGLIYNRAAPGSDYYCKYHQNYSNPRNGDDNGVPIVMAEAGQSSDPVRYRRFEGGT